MQRNITTIRESIDEYRRKISEEGFSGNRQENQFYYPYDNHVVAMKITSEGLKKALEDSGQFQFVGERDTKGVYTYTWDCLPTEAQVIADCLDKGGVDRGCYCEAHSLDGDWTPLSIHPYQSTSFVADEVYSENMKKLGKNAMFTGAIKTLEILLQIAEKNKITMVTEHKGLAAKKILVRHTP